VNITIIIGLCALSVAGVLLIVLGLRGRRVNGHPICRGCGFDLVGVLPSGTTCPECGAGVKFSRWVRIGARKKRVTWVLAGALLGAGAGVPLGAGTLAVMSSVQFVRHKPLGLLLWEARRGSDEARAVIGTELERRMLAKLLDAQQSQSAADLAIEIQADLDRTWQPIWASVFEQAQLAGFATPAQIEQFQLQSIVPELLARPTVRVGDPLPFVVVTKEYRGAQPPSQNAWFSVRIASTTLAGEPAQGPTDSLRPMRQPQFMLKAPAPNTSSMSSSGQSVLVVPEVAPGPQTLEVTVELSATMFNAKGTQRSPTPRTLTIRRDIDVKAASAEPSGQIDLAPEIATELTDLVHKSGITQSQRQHDNSWRKSLSLWSVSFDSSDTPSDSRPVAAIHAHVFIVNADGTERPLGEFRNEAILQDIKSTRSVTRWVEAGGTSDDGNRIVEERVTLRLRMDPRKALNFIRPGPPVQGELEITGVPVRYETNRGTRARTIEERDRVNAESPPP
jgi:hypothetical protein